MAVFAYENGKLIPAQPVDLSMSRLGEGALAALRERAVDLIEAPLFPVAWVTEQMPSGSRDCLICLDPTGQIVTVDVLARLSADELIATLAATGRHADNSTERLASMYASGSESFSADWRAFLDACPPSSRPGPRLFLIVLGIEEEVRPAIDALAGAGVDVRVASVIGSGPQVFISLEPVRPHITALSRILGVARRRAEVEDGTRSARWETNVVATAEGDAASEAAQGGGFGPGYVDAEVVHAPDAHQPDVEGGADAQVSGVQDAAEEANAAAAQADAGAVQGQAVDQNAGEQAHAEQAEAADAQAEGAAQPEAAAQPEQEAAPAHSAGGYDTGSIEIHAIQKQGEAPASRPAARHVSRRGAAGLRSARFGAHADQPAEANPAAAAAFPVAEEDAAASRRRSTRLKNMFAADKRARQAEAAAQAGARQQDETVTQVLPNFEIASHRPVAKQAAETEVPVTRAPESAAAMDSAASTLPPQLPGMSRRERRRRQAEESALRARQEEARAAAARDGEAAEAGAAAQNQPIPAPPSPDGAVQAKAEATAQPAQAKPADHVEPGLRPAMPDADAARADAVRASHLAVTNQAVRAAHAMPAGAAQPDEDADTAAPELHRGGHSKRRRAHFMPPAQPSAQSQTEAQDQAGVQTPALSAGEGPSRASLQTTPDAEARREVAVTYELSRAARLRAEQLLWESSAPIHAEGHPEPQLISESAASSASSDAVEDAAERDYFSASGRLAQIAKRNSTPLSLTWKSQRLGIDLRAQVMPWGTIVLSNGAAYSDPTAAAREQSGIADADGWKVWKAEDGRSLEEL